MISIRRSMRGAMDAKAGQNRSHLESRRRRAAQAPQPTTSLHPPTRHPIQTSERPLIALQHTRLTPERKEAFAPRVVSASSHDSQTAAVAITETMPDRNVPN